MDRVGRRGGRASVPLGRDAAARRPRVGGRRRDICGACHAVGYLRKDVEIYYAVSVSQGRQRPARVAAGAHRRPDEARLRRRVHRDLRAGREHPQARARAPRRTHAQPGPKPALRSADVHRVRHDADRRGTEQPDEAPAGHYMLFAVGAPGCRRWAAIAQLERRRRGGPRQPRAEPARGRQQRVPPRERRRTRRSDGSVSGGLPTSSCTKVASTRWLRVDLGASRTVTTFVVKHAGAGGESAALNTRNFRIETRTHQRDLEHSASRSPTTRRALPPTTVAARSARQVRLVLTPVRAGDDRRRGAYLRAGDLQRRSSRRQRPPAAPLLRRTPNATGRAQRLRGRRVLTVARGSLGVIGNDAGTLARRSRPDDQATILPRQRARQTARHSPPVAHNALPAGWDLAVSSLRVRRL